MKKFLWAVGIIILVLCGILLGIYIGTSNKNEENSDDEQLLDTSKYEGYTFTDIKTYDKKTNGDIVYSLDDEIEYTTKQEVTIPGPACDEKDSLTYSIVNGSVVLKDSNGKSYTFKTIKNAVSILYFAYQSCDNVRIAILTSDSNIYIINYDFYISFEQNVDELIKISSDLKIEKIGTSTVLSSIFAFPDIFAKTTDGQIAVVTSDYDENTDEITYKLELTDSIIEADGIYIHEDATVTFNDYSLVDEDGNKIYALGIYAGAYGETRAYTEGYILDRQGYLYKIDYDDFTDNPSNKVYKVKKYSDKKAKKIGTDSSDNIIILFEDGEALEIKVLIGGSYVDYTVKTFQ